MPSVIPFTSVPPLATISSLPEKSSLKWRRELATCHCYRDALELAFRMIREMERDEKSTKQRAVENHQLAFPWARAD